MNTTSDTAAPTRAEEIRRWVELDALSDFVNDLATYMGDDGEAESRGTGMLRSVWFDTLVVRDGRTDGDLAELTEQLWPDTDLEERESTVGFNLAAAESYALAAQMFALLTTDDARAVLAQLARDMAARAEGAVQRVRTRIERDGGEA